MAAFATIDEMSSLWRAMTTAEQSRAGLLLEAISDRLRMYAASAGVDIDTRAALDETYRNVVRSVVIDVAARTMNIPADDVPMSQMSQSALGYSISGTYLVPGGGIFIKRDELKLLGLRRQKVGVCNYDFNKGHHCNSI